MSNRPLILILFAVAIKLPSPSEKSQNSITVICFYSIMSSSISELVLGLLGHVLLCMLSQGLLTARRLLTHYLLAIT